MRAGLNRLAETSPELFGQGGLLDGIAELESVGNVIKAVQSEWTLVFARGHVDQLIESGVVDPGKLTGRSASTRMKTGSVPLRNSAA